MGFVSCCKRVVSFRRVGLEQGLWALGLYIPTIPSWGSEASRISSQAKQTKHRAVRRVEAELVLSGQRILGGLILINRPPPPALYLRSAGVD